MSETAYTKIENRVKELERKVAGQQSKLTELQTNHKLNESTLYNNMIQSINSANASILSMSEKMQTMEIRTDSLELELKKNVQASHPLASNQEPPTSDSRESQIVDCDLLLLVDSNGKFI